MMTLRSFLRGPGRHRPQDTVSREQHDAVCDERDWLRGALAGLGATSPGEIPSVLKAAAAMPDPGGRVVTLGQGDEQVICVLGDEPGGSPLKWWAAVQRLSRAS